MKKKVPLIIGTLFVLILGIGGGIFLSDKSTSITIEQQKNVAKRIARSYDVTKITFLKISKDIKTGSTTLYFELNGDKSLYTGITVRDVTEFDTPNGLVGLNPINKFEKLKNSRNVPVNLNEIDVQFIEEWLRITVK